MVNPHIGAKTGLDFGGSLGEDFTGLLQNEALPASPPVPKKRAAGSNFPHAPPPHKEGQKSFDLLGTLLMARNGLRTRTVRMAERLTLCPSREYSIMLGERERRKETQEVRKRRGLAPLFEKHRLRQSSLNQVPYACNILCQPLGM